MKITADDLHLTDVMIRLCCYGFSKDMHKLMNLEFCLAEFSNTDSLNCFIYHRNHGGENFF